VCDDLVFRFLQLHQLAKLVGLAGFSLTNDFCVRLKQTDQLVRELVMPAKILALICRTTLCT
jgi:hypothetical protein